MRLFSIFTLSIVVSMNHFQWRNEQIDVIYCQLSPFFTLLVFHALPHSKRGREGINE